MQFYVVCNHALKNQQEMDEFRAKDSFDIYKAVTDPKNPSVQYIYAGEREDTEEVLALYAAVNPAKYPNRAVPHPLFVFAQESTKLARRKRPAATTKVPVLIPTSGARANEEDEVSKIASAEAYKRIRGEGGQGQGAGEEEEEGQQHRQQEEHELPATAAAKPASKKKSR